MFTIRILLFYFFLISVRLTEAAICGTITGTATVTATKTTTVPSIVTSTRTVHMAACTVTQAHTTTSTNHKRTDITLTTTSTPIITRTSTVATHHITVTSPGRTIFLPCPTPRPRLGSEGEPEGGLAGGLGYKRNDKEGRKWADEQGLSNAKRLQLGLPLAKPHQRSTNHDIIGVNDIEKKQIRPSCTTAHITETSNTIVYTTQTPTTWITVTSCVFTHTQDTTSYGRTTVTDTSTHSRTRIGPPTYTTRPVTSTSTATVYTSVYRTLPCP